MPNMSKPSSNQKTTQHLVIMVKEPRQGNVKTRLSKDIGGVAATAFYRRTTNHIIGRLSRDPRWQTHIAIAPDTAINLPFWPEKASKGLKRSSQGHGDLGARMHTQFKNIGKPENKTNGLLIGTGPVLIIGTDIPEITATHVAKAFKQLKNKEALIGPSGDGGYWIIGQKRSPKLNQLFKNIRWSTEHTYNDTIINLDGSRWATTETLSDVDNGPEYKALNHFSRRLIPPAK
ncbi:TIGR04282 family arsenosugar biosynthesis glycosyltransferase [Hyphomicrobiales bacterium 4NK60-0047b]